MSWDFDLTHPVTGEVLVLDTPHHMRGGTYAVGGTCECALNVTYNYGKVFRRFDPDGKSIAERIEGLSGAESIPILETLIGKLGDDVSPDYWEPTEGNAKAALYGLLALAKLRPDGIWKVS